MKLITIILLLIPLVAQGRTGQLVTGIGQYRMSDRESDEQAKQIALERALQQARERAGLFRVAAVSRHATTEWGNGTLYDLYERQTGIRSEVRLRIVDKAFASIEERIRSSVEIRGRTVLFEDRVRYWTCAVDVEVMEIDVETESVEKPLIAVPAKRRNNDAVETRPEIAAALGELPISLEYQLFRSGLECMLQGQWGPARDLFSRLLREDPADGDALYLLAFCLEKSGDHQAFRQVLSRAVRSHPHKSIYGVLEARLDGAARPTLAL